MFALKPAPSRGFTLIEALISVLIMTTITLALLGLVPYGYNEIQVNATQVQAIALGQQYLDALRNAKQTNNPLPTATTAPVDQGNTFMTGSSNATSSVFTITPNPCPTALPGPTASQYDCSVTVTWTENGNNESIKVESYVTQ
ncbi:MAG: prepilin-type N-terminal cleavage/methylation domain-containing protein [Candidatus Eremiobacteraeota bacterium]|nr:prepilin-type N-terminal cleavage/methylation domain-containing protein [Candidatus Eremiobacteraeota bacterium]